MKQQPQQQELQGELRRARRREEKLQALLYRLREDSASPAAFDKLRDVRGLEYELDFVTNRAQRESQVNLRLSFELACGTVRLSGKAESGLCISNPVLENGVLVRTGFDPDITKMPS